MHSVSMIKHHITSPLCFTAITALTFYTNCNFSDLLWASNIQNHRTVCNGCKCDKNECGWRPIRDPGEMSHLKICLLTTMAVTIPTMSCINSKDLPPRYSHQSNYFLRSPVVWMQIWTLALLYSLCRAWLYMMMMAWLTWKKNVQLFLLFSCCCFFYF